MRKFLVGVALLALAGCGGPLLYAELVIPELGMTTPSQPFPASNADPSYWCAADKPDCITTDFTYDLGQQVDLLTKKDVEYELRLTDLSIALDATSAGTDLHGVKSAAVEVIPPGTTTPVEVASYARSAANPSPTSISISGNASVDLAPFVDAGQVHVRVKMSYDAPTPAFAADIRGVFYLRVKLDYGKTLGI
ncbi:hypothetical protein [Anaeromyxobacter oryzae]|uniref:Lipoprotein n=1 Tax=Anaeromyxobacter oryzae TaxID=2918170 RepID=A0ABM7WYB6_9BACT|nr:hypothetical protein [Anaeromyxobacter oryzae]BDG04523.1 hypothetical protein AMOR_35190 [Anaeromyxobacter oryzae]